MATVDDSFDVRPFVMFVSACNDDRVDGIVVAAVVVGLTFAKPMTIQAFTIIRTKSPSVK